MATTYEWVAEEVPAEDGFDFEVQHGETRAEVERYAANMRADGRKTRIGLVRDHDDFHGTERTWAYVGVDGQLPERFVDAWDREATKVPAKYLREKGA